MIAMAAFTSLPRLHCFFVTNMSAPSGALRC
ncbi:MAG: hypothetical protein CFH38_00803 [Alphaproteobacteria bacterium MarineAlpha10_Bin1]|nr:MAG: hypothetical protein CFH38_00803 [Alphaproteobacteria bacterium MarineAlpha10_Bin1]